MHEKHVEKRVNDWSEEQQRNTVNTDRISGRQTESADFGVIIIDVYAKTNPNLDRELLWVTTGFSYCN